jgi:hypothetical protein
MRSEVEDYGRICEKSRKDMQKKTVIDFRMDKETYRNYLSVCEIIE